MKIWKDEYDPSQIIKRLQQLPKRTMNASQAFRFEECEALLYSMVKFPANVPETQRRTIVSQAISNTSAKGSITNDSLRNEIGKLIGEYLSIPLARYVLVTSLSLSNIGSLPRIKIKRTTGMATVIFEADVPRPYQKGVTAITAQARRQLLAAPPSNYLSVRVHVSARSIDGAAEKALDTLDLVRGIWNLFYNRGHLSRMSWGGELKPVNRIVLGPIHTIHYPNGRLATDRRWWYEPTYRGAMQVHNPTRDIDGMYEFLGFARDRLSKSGYREVLERAIIQYNRALDEPGLYTTFLKLWVVLESLTNTHGSYKELIRRGSFAFGEEHDYYRQVLQHLRDYRNRFVHEAVDAVQSREREAYVYQLKCCVEVLLAFHFNPPLRFASLCEACKFLDLSANRDILKSSIQKLKYAEKYLGYS